jgi:outer membrane protein OmpA-like peptidoglycan-associated protein
MKFFYAILLLLLFGCAPTPYMVVDQETHEITPVTSAFIPQTQTGAIKRSLEQSMGDIPGVRLIALGDSVSVMMSSDAMFAVGSSSMADDVTSDLLPFVKVAMHDENTQVQVEVFTDSSGRASQNERLSEDRAKAIAGYFMEQGIEPSRIAIKGYGDAYPLAPNDTLENKALNRRIMLTLTVSTPAVSPDLL